MQDLRVSIIIGLEQNGFRLARDTKQRGSILTISPTEAVIPGELLLFRKLWQCEKT